MISSVPRVIASVPQIITAAPHIVTAAPQIITADPIIEGASAAEAPSDPAAGCSESAVATETSHDAERSGENAIHSHAENHTLGAAITRTSSVSQSKSAETLLLPSSTASHPSEPIVIHLQEALLQQEPGPSDSMLGLVQNDAVVTLSPAQGPPAQSYPVQEPLTQSGPLLEDLSVQRVRDAASTKIQALQRGR